MISEQQSNYQVFIDGELVDSLPMDLYIPPDALRVLLDTFSGPLDLLLYLIRKQNIDILDIPIVKITEQYLQYIELLEAHRFELAAEYLLMAATLAEIKSRMLLPVLVDDEEEESDPRMALVRQLQAYEKIKSAAEAIGRLPCLEVDFHAVQIKQQGVENCIMFPPVELAQLVMAMQSLLETQSHRVNHQITRETLSVSDRMTAILTKIRHAKTLPFSQLYYKHEGRIGLVVSVLALLELAKSALITIDQAQAYGQMTIKVVS